MEKRYDVVIIGAGLGGLSAATNLAKNGLKTLLVEKHALVDGYCCGFKRKGFLFQKTWKSMKKFWGIIFQKKKRA